MSGAFRTTPGAPSSGNALVSYTNLPRMSRCYPTVAQIDDTTCRGIAAIPKDTVFIGRNGELFYKPGGSGFIVPIGHNGSYHGVWSVM